jgi:GDP-4-dehydro-6-deoxy-D-mannose reductase
MRARIFNLLGPGQPENLVPATFIKQFKAMREGESLRVGNLSTRRDFVDVRDVVWAFDKLLTKGQPGMAYNIASGKSVSIREVLNEMLSISGFRDISIEQDSVRIRENDVPDVVADITAITEMVGWRPQISLRESLEAMYKQYQNNCEGEK